MEGDHIMEEMKKIYKTKNYEKFKFMVGNRPINSAHTAKLIESIKGKYLFNPIIINEKWEIIDGQHRFEAIKQLNLPLYFFINEGYSYDEVVILNENQKNWGHMDFLLHYVSIGNKEYIEVKKIMEKYKITLTATLAFLQAGNSKATEEFKYGQFKINEIEKIKAIESIRKYNKIKGFWEFSGSYSFVRAFTNLLEFEDFNFERFNTACRNYPNLIGRRSRSTDYLILFQKLYNWKRSKKVRLIHDDI